VPPQAAAPTFRAQPVPPRPSPLMVAAAAYPPAHPYPPVHQISSLNPLARPAPPPFHGGQASDVLQEPVAAPNRLLGIRKFPLFQRRIDT